MNSKNLIFTTFCAISLLLCSAAPVCAADSTSVEPAVVIFDVGDVLVKYDWQQAVPHMGGYLDLGLFAFWHPWRFGELVATGKEELFKLLETVDVQSYDEGSEYHNKPLPAIMRAHQKNEIPLAKIIAKVDAAITNNKDYSESQRAIMRGMAKVTFDPQTNAEIMKLIPGMFELAQKCKECGHTVYILSNYNAEAFTALEERFPDVFKGSTFDKLFVSGRMLGVVAPDRGVAKPDPRIYQAVLKEADPNKRKIFIDDNLKNVETARACGITAIHHTGLYTTEAELIKTGILPQPEPQPFIQSTSASLNKNKKKLFYATAVIAGVYGMYKWLRKPQESMLPTCACCPPGTQQA